MQKNNPALNCYPATFFSRLKLSKSNSLFIKWISRNHGEIKCWECALSVLLLLLILVFLEDWVISKRVSQTFIVIVGVMQLGQLCMWVVSVWWQVLSKPVSSMSSFRRCSNLSPAHSKWMWSVAELWADSDSAWPLAWCFRQYCSCWWQETLGVGFGVIAYV